jgi:hypothetical protein
VWPYSVPKMFMWVRINSIAFVTLPAHMTVHHISSNDVSKIYSLSFDRFWSPFASIHKLFDRDLVARQRPISRKVAASVVDYGDDQYKNWVLIWKSKTVKKLWDKWDYWGERRLFANNVPLSNVIPISSKTIPQFWHHLVKQISSFVQWQD